MIGFTRDPRHPIPGCIETRKFSPDEKVNLDGCEAIIHLAGEPVAGIWTQEKRRKILESRTLGTRRITDAIKTSSNPPRVLVSSSAIGFYGNTGESEVDEDSPHGSGFLSEVCQAWEAEALRAKSDHTRVVLLRTSLVLGREGGALRLMLPIFRCSLGGKLGSGRQWMAWIHIDDEAALTLFATENDRIEGPLNAVAPNPCRNADFTKDLAHAVHRPAFFRTPAFLLKTVLGGFSHELLDSRRILPKRAPAAGFKYCFQTLDAAFSDLI